LFSWYTEHFVHGELTICIAGNYDAAAVRTRIELMPLHTLPAGKRHFPNQIPAWKPGLNFITAPFRQEQFFVLFPLQYPVDEKTYYSLIVLNALTGDTMSSRLFQRLREKGGYCYSVYSFFSFYEDTGCWCAYASSAKRSSARILSDIRSELENLITGGVSEDEIDAAREHLCGEELIAAEDAEYRMKRLERNVSSGYPLRTTDETIACIRSVTEEDVIRCIRLLLVPARKSLVVYGPKLSDEERGRICALFPDQGNGGEHAESDSNTMYGTKRRKAARIQN
jgi:predicted Zn-dependent peptidase